MLKLSAEYNRRTAIIEGLGAGRSTNTIIEFFGYPRSTILWRCGKYTALEQFNEGSSMSTKKSHSRKNSLRGSPQSLKGFNKRWFRMTNDSGQSKIRASIVGVSEPTMRRIAKKDFQYKSYTLKIRQMISEVARTNRVARLGSHSGLPTVQI